MTVYTFVWKEPVQGRSLVGRPNIDGDAQGDLIAGAHLALFQDAEIESRPVMGDQQGRHPGLVHSYADAVAGDTRLRDFEKGTADDFIFGSNSPHEELQS
jgi:hypothetical protein